ncbi:MAG: 50S ribosomal protein L28 [Patescibacteria group bacterium]
MSKVCEQCGKKPSVGHLVSHSNIKTLRRFEPNLVKKKVVDPATGKLVRVKVCTGCLRTMVKVRVKRVKKTK